MAPSAATSPIFPNGAPGPKLLLQRVTEPTTLKNRMHFDIEVADIDPEADRLVALGATRASEGTCSEHDSTWLLMRDPEGNELCICDRPEQRGAMTMCRRSPVVRPGPLSGAVGTAGSAKRVERVDALGRGGVLLD